MKCKNNLKLSKVNWTIQFVLSYHYPISSSFEFKTKWPTLIVIVIITARDERKKKWNKKGIMKMNNLMREKYILKKKSNRQKDGTEKNLEDVNENNKIICMFLIGEELLKIIKYFVRLD